MRRRGFLVVLLVLLFAVSNAGAQDRFAVRGLGFGTFARTEARPTRVFGVGVGLNVNRVVQVTIEAAREWGRTDPRNPDRAIATGPISGGLTIVALGIETTRQDRRLTGGVRFRAPSWHRFEPFAVVNVGVARVTDRYLPNVLGEQGATRLEILEEAGGGLSLAITDRLRLESSYRIGRVEGGYPFTVHALGGGVAVGF